MFNKIISSVVAHLTPVNPEDVTAYRSTIPQTIDVSIERHAGMMVATINSIDGETIDGLLVTEAQTFDEIVDNVNDLLFTYLKMPGKIRPFYSRILQPSSKTVKQSGKLTLVRA